MRLEEIVDRANSNELMMDGTTHPVTRIIDAAEVVFAVWQDDGAERGVSSLIIKGAALLRRIASGNEPVAVRWDAIKVLSFNMAVAAHHQLGDGEPFWHHDA